MTMPQSNTTMFVGQWRDTVPVSDAGRMVVRMVPHRFTGDMRGHCHLSADGDLGMMTNAVVNDANGVGSSHASTLRGQAAADQARAALRNGLCAAQAAAATTTAPQPTTTQAVSAGTPVCGNGVIEAAEQCEPPGACCPQCKLAAAGTVCRPAAGVAAPCDVADTCDGVSGACVDRKAPLGQTCSNSGASAPAPSDSACTKRLTCDGATGFCAAANSGGGTVAALPCDDKDACTVGDVCNSFGECRGNFTCPCTNDADCSSRAPRCTTSRCNLSTSQCVNTIVGAGLLCDDLEPCTTDDRCDAGGVCAGKNSCPAGCSEPNGRCCAGACECDARFTGPTCADEITACARGDIGCDCTDAFKCNDPAAVCDCTSTDACSTAKPLCRAKATVGASQLTLALGALVVAGIFSFVELD
jgi:hypothetical protein